MISPWWLIAAFIIGGWVGFFTAAGLSAAGRTDEEVGALYRPEVTD